MKKNYFVLFLLLGFSCAVSAQNNVFCGNKDTASEECAATAQKMYQMRIGRIAGKYAQTRKKKEGKDVEKKQAMYFAMHSQPADKFNEAFKACGEGSRTQNDAQRCLERQLGNTQKIGKKAARPTKNKNV